MENTHWVIFDKRHKLRIGHHTVECAIELLGQVTLYLEIPDLALEAARLHKARELGQARESLAALGRDAAEMSCHDE